MNLLEELADFCQNAGEFPTALEYYTQILDLADRASRSGDLLAQTALKMAVCLQGTGKYKQALEMLDLAKRNIDTEKQPIDTSRVLIERSHVHLRTGDYDEARKDAFEAMEILKAHTLSTELAEVFRSLGHYYLRTGRMEKAQEAYEASLAIARALGDRQTVAKCLNNLGLVAKNLGRLNEAADYFGKALSIARELGNKLQIGIRLNNYAIVEFKLGKWDEAKEAWEEAIRTFRELGNKWEISLGYLNLAQIHRATRNWKRAEELFELARRTAEENDHRRCVVLYHEHFGELCVRRGELERADRLFTEGLDRAKTMHPENEIIAEILRRRGECRTLSGDWEEAAEDLRTALTIGRRVGDRFEEGTILRALGVLHRLRKEPDHAEQTLRRAMRLLGTIGARYEWALAVHAFAELAVNRPALRREAMGLVPEALEAFKGSGGAYEEARLGLVEAELHIEEGEGLRATERIGAIQPVIEENGADEDRERLRDARVRADRLIVSSSVSDAGTLASFNVLLQRLQEIHNLEDRLQTALDILLERTRAERSVLLLQGSPGGPLEVRDSRRVPAKEWHLSVEVSRIAVGHTLTNGARPILSTNPMGDSRLDTTRPGFARIGSLLAIPILGETEITGGIYLDRPLGEPSFGQEELDFALALASVVGGVLRDLKTEEIRSENLRLRHRFGHGDGFERIVTQSQRMLKIIETLKNLRESTATILLQGETGTGKELFARAVHSSSLRKDKPFVTVNCAELSEDVLESELFGHRKGAFTDAKTSKIGLFERANGGTVFIDEIDKASRHFQDTLLRVVDRKEIKPVGADSVIQVDVRIVCAANKNLREEVEKDRFLKDLYYRLRVVSIYLPPLRERKEDIPILVEHFLSKHAKRAGKRIGEVRPDAMQALMSHGWPGNVRDLEHEIERVVAITADEAPIRATDLNPEVTQGMTLGEGSTLAEVVERVERQLIREALADCEWNKSRTARQLGLSRRGLLNKLERYRIR
ncbi:MAG: sigma 54-interacting transcriptional regulator [Candidatus Eisenbacteria bacterium]|nr:sigma 54-interacting transcriptional regulator [Candidatus Eisenbacteria bacterium]